MFSVSREIESETGQMVTMTVTVSKDGSTKITATGPDFGHLEEAWSPEEAEVLYDLLTIANDFLSRAE